MKSSHMAPLVAKNETVLVGNMLPMDLCCEFVVLCCERVYDYLCIFLHNSYIKLIFMNDQIVLHSIFFFLMYFGVKLLV